MNIKGVALRGIRRRSAIEDFWPTTIQPDLRALQSMQSFLPAILPYDLWNRHKRILCRFPIKSIIGAEESQRHAGSRKMPAEILDDRIIRIAFAPNIRIFRRKHFSRAGEDWGRLFLKWSGRRPRRRGQMDNGAAKGKRVGSTHGLVDQQKRSILHPRDRGVRNTEPVWIVFLRTDIDQRVVKPLPRTIRRMTDRYPNALAIAVQPVQLFLRNHLIAMVPGIVKIIHPIEFMDSRVVRTRTVPVVDTSIRQRNFPMLKRAQWIGRRRVRDLTVCHPRLHSPAPWPSRIEQVTNSLGIAHYAPAPDIIVWIDKNRPISRLAQPHAI